MAETALTVNSISETPYDMTTREDADETNGNKAANPNGDLFFVLLNTDGANSATVTFAAQKTSVDFAGYGPMAKANLAVALAANEEKIVGPFKKQPWNDANGDVLMAITGTGAAGVKINAFKPS